MKCALTIVPENGRLSPMYDAAKHLVIIECRRRDGGVAQQEELPADPAERLGFFREKRIELLFTGAISNQDAANLDRIGIRVVAFAAGDWRDVWDAWKMRAELKPCHLMPGCCRRRCGRSKGD
ncbi:MAG: hypothetical protein AB7F32_11385 [Victivallaceae bacterium]